MKMLIKGAAGNAELVFHHMDPPRPDAVLTDDSGEGQWIYDRLTPDSITFYKFLVDAAVEEGVLAPERGTKWVHFLTGEIGYETKVVPAEASRMRSERPG
jgi:hypothetical protein